MVIRLRRGSHALRQRGALLPTQHNSAHERTGSANKREASRDQAQTLRSRGARTGDAQHARRGRCRNPNGSPASQHSNAQRYGRETFWAAGRNGIATGGLLEWHRASSNTTKCGAGPARPAALSSKHRETKSRQYERVLDAWRNLAAGVIVHTVKRCPCAVATFRVRPCL